MKGLFVAGLHCTPDIWEDAARVPGLEPICIDWPTTGIESMDDAARWVASQIEAHDIDLAVGHSLGGTTLLHLFGHLQRRPRIPSVICDSFMVHPHEMFRNHVWDGPTALEERIRSMLEEERPRFTALREMAMAFEEDDAWREAAVATGATFVYGGRGGDVDAATVARRAGVPDHGLDQVHVVPGTSHFLMLERPDVFYGIVQSVMARSRRLES